MALATVHSRAQNGLDAAPVTVEVHLGPGLPGFSIVGLPEAAVREARDRVRAAITHCGYAFPQRRIICNLAPADLPKEGGRFDLAIALGILIASGVLPESCVEGVEVLGELSLSGEIRSVRGALPAALKARDAQHALLLPEDSVAEAALARGVRMRPVRHLAELCAALLGAGLDEQVADVALPSVSGAMPDLADVRGQPGARRALEIAAAGGHSMLMVGPPGSGKSLLASRLPGLLPPMTDDEALEVAAIASISVEGFDSAQWGLRPHRSPHHTASGVALVGGGANPRPGEITLAHHGVLFLDELPEFDRPVLEVLREPLETGRISISRAAARAEFPARFQLVAAMNPCPCGYLGDGERCRCTPDQVQRYRNKLSGPLLDRIDLQVFVPRVPAAVLTSGATGDEEDSATVRERVCAARALQAQRAPVINARLAVRQVESFCLPDPAGQQLLGRALERLGLSARAYHRVLKVARTIADLGGRETVSAADVAESLRYRELDRSNGG